VDLDEACLTQIRKIEHKVRGALGLYEGLARRLLNEISESDSVMRRFVQLHADQAKEASGSIAAMFRCLSDLIEQLPQPPVNPPMKADSQAGPHETRITSDGDIRG
jgi:hypothetical protein